MRGSLSKPAPRVRARRCVSRRTASCASSSSIAWPPTRATAVVSRIEDSAGWWVLYAVLALAGIVLHRVFLLGDAVTPELVGRVLDEVILPAALNGPCPSAPTVRPL